LSRTAPFLHSRETTWLCLLFVHRSLSWFSDQIRKVVYRDQSGATGFLVRWIGPWGTTAHNVRLITAPGRSVTVSGAGCVLTYAVSAEGERLSRLFLCGFLAGPLASVILEPLRSAPCRREINLIPRVPRTSFSHRLGRCGQLIGAVLIPEQ